MAQSFNYRGKLTANGVQTGFHSYGSNVIYVEGIVDVQKRLARLQSKHPNMDKDLKKIMRAVIAGAKKEMQNAGKSVVGSGYEHSSGDKRKAYKAIKSLVYKRVFGGNVNIISKRKRSGYVASLPPKKTQHGRGGNRRPRSLNTERMMSYWGEDRGFVLRWLNSGTDRRLIKTYNNRSVAKMVGRGHNSKSLESFRNGRRGKIEGRGWFADNSMNAMYHASEQLTHLIDRAIVEVWGEGSVKDARWLSQTVSGAGGEV